MNAASQKLKTSGLDIGSAYQDEQESSDNTHNIGEALHFGDWLNENFAGVSTKDKTALEVAHANIKDISRDTVYAQKVQKLIEENQKRWGGISEEKMKDLQYATQVSLIDEHLKTNRAYINAVSDTGKQQLKTATIAQITLERLLPDFVIKEIRQNLPKGAADPIVTAAHGMVEDGTTIDEYIKKIAEKGIRVQRRDGSLTTIQLKPNDIVQIKQILTKIVPIIETHLNPFIKPVEEPTPATPPVNAPQIATAVSVPTPTTTTTTTKPTTTKATLTPSELFIQNCERELEISANLAQNQKEAVYHMPAEEQTKEQHQQTLTRARQRIAEVRKLQEELKKPEVKQTLQSLDNKAQEATLQAVKSYRGKVQAGERTKPNTEFTFVKKSFKPTTSKRLLNFRLHKPTFTSLNQFASAQIHTIRGKITPKPPPPPKTLPKVPGTSPKSFFSSFKFPNFASLRLNLSKFFSNIIPRLKNIFTGLRSLLSSINFGAIGKFLSSMLGRFLRFALSGITNLIKGALTAGVLPLLEKGWNILKKVIPGLENVLKALHINDFKAALLIILLIVGIFIIAAALLLILFQNARLACPISLPEPYQTACGNGVLQFILH